MIETELLRSFAAFADTRNFTRAARRLGISQPALFERVQKLAEHLGLTLYERVGRELVLTADGTRVLVFARDVEKRFHDFMSELEGTPVHRTVTLAAGEGSYLYLLGPAIEAFGKESSAVLQLLTKSAKGTVEALRCGDAQLGVAVLEQSSIECSERPFNSPRRGLTGSVDEDFVEGSARARGAGDGGRVELRRCCAPRSE